MIGRAPLSATIRALRAEVEGGPPADLGREARELGELLLRFYRVDPGRSREQGGTGLGLAIVKHLVQGMAGEVSVESGAGGTCFRVRLPAT